MSKTGDRKKAVLVIDGSGSMQGKPLEVVNDTLAKLKSKFSDVFVVSDGYAYNIKKVTFNGGVVRVDKKLEEFRVEPIHGGVPLPQAANLIHDEIDLTGRRVVFVDDLDSMTHDVNNASQGRTFVEALDTLSDKLSVVSMVDPKRGDASKALKYAMENGFEFTTSNMSKTALTAALRKAAKVDMRHPDVIRADEDLTYGLYKKEQAIDQKQARVAEITKQMEALKAELTAERKSIRSLTKEFAEVEAARDALRTVKPKRKTVKRTAADPKAK